MNWIWTTAFTAKGVPVADFDDRRSTIPSSDIVGTERLLQRSPSDIVVLSRVSPYQLDSMHALPNTNRCPLIDGTLIAIVQQYADRDVQFMPVTVRAKGGEVVRFSYARPLLYLPCLDVEKSDIEDWIVPGQRIMDARLLVFKPDCLGGRHFARDSYTGYIVVSDQLKDTLLATDKGLKFDLPENVWNIFQDQPKSLH